jgi:arginyl-tRNA synthetase
MSVKSAALDALSSAFSLLGLQDSPSIVRSTKPQFGDLQCNDMMRLGKALGRNPRELASDVASFASKELSAEVTIAGPGFINFKFSDEVIATEATRLMNDPDLGAEKVHSLRTVIDFGGPNVAKALHVGHLRSFVIGESLRRILIEVGHDVVSDIHLGDWGLQMGKLLLGVAHSSGWKGGDAANFISPFACDEMTVAELGEIYALGNALCSDDNMLDVARSLTTRLQEGETGLRSTWERMRKISLEAIASTSSFLDAHFDLFLGESDAHQEVAPMLSDLVERGLARESDGALVINVSGGTLPQNVPPLLLRKSDGAALYGTTDLATLRQRVRDLGAQQVVYCTDDRQALHIESVFAAARAAGYAAEAQLHHAPFGTVRGPDGKPFKTRDGTAASLRDMVDLALSKAEEKVSDPSIAGMVAVGALKFADLSSPRKTGYVFEIDKMTSFEGRTGPYLQYAFARISSILDKADQLGITPAASLSVSHPSERAVLFECLWYPHSLSEAARQLEPFEIAERAYQVADAFSRFYADCPVLAGSDPAGRLATCKLVSEVLKKCLHLLGISAIRRM